MYFNSSYFSFNFRALFLKNVIEVKKNKQGKPIFSNILESIIICCYDFFPRMVNTEEISQEMLV